MRVRKGPFRARRHDTPSFFESARAVFQLYMQDFKSEDLAKLFWKEPRQVYRFFIAEIEREELQRLPLVKRILRIIRLVFMGISLKMAPARRIFFVLAFILFLSGFLDALGQMQTFPGSLLLSFLMFNLLLALELADKLVIKSDLDVARQIQFSLLPQEKLDEPGIDVYGLTVPANTVGGDYYDILRLSDTEILLVIGDVSGKGAPAALLMAYLQASLRALASDALPLRDLVKRLNTHLYKNTPDNRLVTLFCARLNLTTRRLIYINAGHNPPLLVSRGGGVQKLSEGGIPLSIRPEAEFPEVLLDLQPGDLLLLYTDGVTEAANQAGEEFGEGRLEALVCNKKALRAELLAQEIVDNVRGFVYDEKFTDDLTMLILGVQGH